MSDETRQKRGVGMPATLKLEHFGREVYNAFGYAPYLVGSAATSKEWRDVDVRLILPDDKFAALFGEMERPRCMNAKWNAYCLAFTALGQDMTGLPIDFQIDQQTDANENYPGFRSAIGIMVRFADQVNTAVVPEERKPQTATPDSRSRGENV